MRVPEKHFLKQFIHFLSKQFFICLRIALRVINLGNKWKHSGLYYIGSIVIATL